ncbi:prion-like-(Q/N-rich) domain-bearing protein 25 [Cimex lectularius]|uniref:EB domain-containing protein n=1 Tax=Cimex lectularius TaxID=79782 RepID=A0A8I6RAV4_CIMLE|nr:prion-like-(Q/N-rich) domain-bearing protein 25 [Cimex lectularius]
MTSKLFFISTLFACSFVSCGKITLPLTKLLRRSNRPCDLDEDCTTPNSYCYERSMCLCRDTYIAVNQNKTSFICIPAAKQIGDHCIYDIQCEKTLGTLSICLPRSSESVGNCTCRQGSHFRDNRCYKTARIGEPCTVHNNCHIKSSDIKVYCTSGYGNKGVCVCPPGFHSLDNGTDCIASSELGGECISDASCTALNTKCLARCVCKEKYVLNAAKNQCLPHSTGLNGYCREDVQCSAIVNVSICHPIKKKCVCSEMWSREINGTCFPVLKLDEACSHNHECHPGSENDTSVECYNGYCQCVHGAIRNGNDCILLRSIIGDTGGRSVASTSFSKHRTILPAILPILYLYFR